MPGVGLEVGLALSDAGHDFVLSSGLPSERAVGLDIGDAAPVVKDLRDAHHDSRGPEMVAALRLYIRSATPLSRRILMLPFSTRRSE
jgi:hypothetical protein